MNDELIPSQNPCRQVILSSLEEARLELERFMEDPQTLEAMSRMVDVMAGCLRTGGKILSIGNGGSLCDAMHFAEELTGRFRRDRRPLAALSAADAAFLTCTANDMSFLETFERWVEALGRKGDVLLAISTSGRSENVVRAARRAREMGLSVIGLTCQGENPLSGLCNVAVRAPRAPHSDRIQEIHIKVIHITIEALEKVLGLA